MSAPTLDHVGVVTRDLIALADQYEGLGFNLTPLARHTDGRIGNRCAMLDGSYIELLAVVDPKAKSATLDRFLARYVGIHILAFAINDEQAVLARLRRAGVEAASVSEFERAIDDGDPSGPRVKFALIQLPDQPEGRINLVRHLTPDLLWQQRFLHHHNNAVALTEVTVDVAEPADTAARFSRLIGCTAVPDLAGGFALDLTRGRVQLRPATGNVPRIAGLVLETSDGNAAITRLVVERNVAHRRDDDALVVDPDAAGGALLRFVPASP